ncbi:MAG TPA: FAD-dependent oxidoreductase [Polyangia bacterium]
MKSGSPFKPPPRGSGSLSRRNALTGAAALAGLGAAGLSSCGDSNAERMNPGSNDAGVPSGAGGGGGGSGGGNSPDANPGDPNPTPGPDSNSGSPSGRPRVAVIGGGAGGIFTAYLLGGVCDVDLFEERPKLGGHCDSQFVDYEGHRIAVDLGAQFFHPDTHPLYTTLLEEIGLFKPDDTDADETVDAPGSVCVFPTSGGTPVFASTEPLATPIRAIEFATYAQQARQAITGAISWDVTLDDWIKSLSVSQPFKDDLLYPWLTSLIGTQRAKALVTSARSILQTFALAFPQNLLQGARTYNSAIGLGGNLQRIAEGSQNTRIHLTSPVTALSFENRLWHLQTPAGRSGPFDAIVVNAPPRVSKNFFESLPGTGALAALLGAYDYFDSRVVIHTDPAYVHPDRKRWAVYNAGITDGECEGSAWIGGLHEKLPSGATVDIFKSWAQSRRADPKNILLERRFKHPLITPATVRAARGLGEWQGRNGVFFGGQHTTGTDMQDSALFSAMKVAQALAPASPTLSALKARLTLRGRTAVSYAL